LHENLKPYTLHALPSPTVFDFLSEQHNYLLFHLRHHG